MSQPPRPRARRSGFLAKSVARGFARRRNLRGLAAAACAWACLGWSCIAPKPTPDDWMAFGHRSPEATVRSFLTALAGDRPDLEYLCLSRGLKDREGGNLIGYLVFRDELRKQMPWLKAAARAEIEQVEALGADRARVHARVEWLFWDETFEVELQADGYFEYYAGADRLDDGYLAFAPSPQSGRVLLVLPEPEEGTVDEVTEIRAGKEWKIDALVLPPPSP